MFIDYQKYKDAPIGTTCKVSAYGHTAEFTILFKGLGCIWGFGREIYNMPEGPSERLVLFRHGSGSGSYGPLKKDFWSELPEAYASWSKIVMSRVFMHFHSPEESFVIDGHFYTDGGNTTGKDTSCNGHAGRLFKIRKADGSLLVTNNLWTQGDVCPEHRDICPDNATFE